MPPISILVKPSSGLCNLRCKYCFYADVKKNRSVENYGFMSYETHVTMVKEALRYGEGSVNFAFQGGEPTLSKLSFFRRHVLLCELYNEKKLKVSNSIQTNGFLIDEEWAEFLAKNDFLVGLSIDGPKEINDTFRVDSNGNGTYDQIMKTIKLFNKYKVQYNILCVVNNVVANNAEKVMNFFISRGIKYVQFIPCLDGFNDEDNHDYSLSIESYTKFLKVTFDKYYKYYKNNNYISIRNFDNYIGIILGNKPESCGMSGVCTSYFTIEGDGSVYPCDFYVIDKYKLGHINTHTFEQMINSETSKQFVKESLHIDPKCMKCKYYNICRGGCRRNREPFVDSKPSLNKYCDSFYQFFDYSIEKMKDIARDVILNNR